MTATDGPSRKIVAAAIVVVLIAASLTIIVAYRDERGQETITYHTTESSSSSSSSQASTSMSGGPTTFYSPISPSGLRLQITLNSTSTGSHGGIAAQVEALNTLNHNVSVQTTPNQNISAWNGYDFFCANNPSDSLVGFALFKGHLSARNVSAAGSPLQLAAPIAVPCAFRLPANGTTMFLPNSDKTMSSYVYAGQLQPLYPVTADVNATTSYCVTSQTSSSQTSSGCPSSSGLVGYWNPGFGYTGNMTYASKDFNYFPPGEYTIVAEDDWNQTVYARFSVAPSAGNTVSTVQTMTVNGSMYYADDISGDISVGNPGYSFLHNASVTLLGVKFETYCPPTYAGCPVPPGTTITTATTMFLGAIRLNATFLDKSTETFSAVIGDDPYVFAFSHHNNPRVGILVVYSGGSASGYKAYLLVSMGTVLRLSLTTSSSSGGPMVTVMVDEYNPLPATVNITASDRWSVPLGMLNVTPCWMDSWPVGFAMASGHYTSSNIISAKLLDLVNPGVTYSCPLYITFGYAAGYLFQPMSDTATAYRCAESYCPTQVVSISVGPSSWPSLAGYWDQGGAFTSFPHGTYTVLAEDEWGN